MKTLNDLIAELKASVKRDAVNSQPDLYAQPSGLTHKLHHPSGDPGTINKPKDKTMIYGPQNLYVGVYLKSLDAWVLDPAISPDKLPKIGNIPTITEKQYNHMLQAIAYAYIVDPGYDRLCNGKASAEEIVYGRRNSPLGMYEAHIKKEYDELPSHIKEALSAIARKTTVAELKKNSSSLGVSQDDVARAMFGGVGRCRTLESNKAPEKVEENDKTAKQNREEVNAIVDSMLARIRGNEQKLVQEYKPDSNQNDTPKSNKDDIDDFINSFGEASALGNTSHNSQLKDEYSDIGDDDGVL